jgi:hypothetical protein
MTTVIMVMCYCFFAYYALAKVCTLCVKTFGHYALTKVWTLRVVLDKNMMKNWTICVDGHYVSVWTLSVATPLTQDQTQDFLHCRQAAVFHYISYHIITWRRNPVGFLPEVWSPLQATVHLSGIFYLPWHRCAGTRDHGY